MSTPVNGPSRTRRTRIVTALLALACSMAALAGPLPERASAGHNTPCTDGDITRAVNAVSGNEALGHLCNPRLYNGGNWDNYAALETVVRGVLNTCGDSAAQRNLTQAVIEVTGIPPDGTVCSQGIYQELVDKRFQSPPTIDWSKYKGPDVINVDAAYGAVYTTMFECSQPEITQAVIRQTTDLPNRAETTGTPDVGGTQGHITSGRCNASLYNSGELYDWGQLVTAVNNRKNAGNPPSCDPLITQAVRELTGGWNPLPHECVASRYGAGWATYAVAKRRIYASWRCRDPWIGQAYVISVGRRVNGRGESGECNRHLYGAWSDYAGLAERVRQVNGIFAANKIELRPNGSVRHTIGGVTVTVPAPETLINNTLAGVIAAGGGNLISDNGLGVIAPGGGNVISLPNGGWLALGGGNVIAPGGGNVIAPGGGNVIAGGGGNVVAAGGLN